MPPRKRQTPRTDALEHFATGSGVDRHIDALGPTGDATDRVVRIPLDALIAATWQSRLPITPESVTELAEQIRSVGLLHPVVVRPIDSPDGAAIQRYEIIAGHRRVETFRLLARSDPEYASVPATIKDLGDIESVVATQVENLGRRDQSTWETAKGVESLQRVLVAAGLPSTIDAIRERLGWMPLVAPDDKGDDADGSTSEKRRSKGGVSQYLKIARTVTEDMLLMAGATVSGDASGEIDRGLVRRLTHRPLMRVAKAPVSERVEVLRAELTNLRAPAKPRKGRRKKEEASASPAGPQPAANSGGAVPQEDNCSYLFSVRGIKDLTPEEARWRLERMAPVIAALAEVAGSGAMVVDADAGAGIVASIRSVDPKSSAGQFVLDRLAERLAERHRELRDGTAHLRSRSGSPTDEHEP